jgi:hypothetical protein
MQYSTPPPGKDPQLWEIAQRRASFKYHFAVYIIMNGFFWFVWYLSGEHSTDNGWPWPVWPMAGWGIGLLFHYLSAYVYPKSNTVEREYEKLKQQQNK